MRACIGKVIEAVMPAVEELKYCNLMQGNSEVSIAQILKAADEADTNPDGYLDKACEGCAECLQVWSANA